MLRFRTRLSNYKFYQLLHRIKYKFIDHRNKRIAIKTIKEKLKFDKDASLYIYTPTHTNLGDHAIAFATMQLFEKSNFKYIEITDKELHILHAYKSLNIFDKRNIIFHGGGYLGTLWINCEYLARKIVGSNPNSQIVFLPNTIFYEQDENGQHELNRSIQIYNNHKNLLIYAREKVSYEFMKKIYNNVKLCPDMVLSLEGQDTYKSRNGCLVCLRNDHEKTLDEKSTELVLKQIESAFNDNYIITDMYSLSTFDIQDREKILQDKFDQFRGAELVITDRLHGMVFSAITGTPCIVINSKSPKVKGCYEWIKDLGYIRFCTDLSNITDMTRELSKFKNCKYDNSALQGYYTDLMEFIKQ